MRQYDSDSYAAHLLDLPKLAHDGCEPVRVEIHVLKYRDITPGRVELLGIDQGVLTLVSTSSNDSDNQENHDVNPPIPDQSNSADEGNDSETDTGFDLLQLLEEGNEASKGPKRARTTRTKKNNSTADQVGSDSGDEIDCVDSILKDPAVRTFLSADQIKAMRDAQEMCRMAEVQSSFVEGRHSLFGDGGSESEGDSARRYAMGLWSGRFVLI